MYSTCILVSEAAELEDRHPIETGRVMQAAVTMLKGGGDGTRPELKLSRLGGLDNQPCWVLSPPSWCRTKFLPGLQSDAAAIVREYRQHEAVLPRIGSEREQAKNYRPAKDRMTFLTYSAGAANGWVVGNGPIAAETPRDFEAFVHRGQDLKNISLNSPGGNLVSGLRLGELFRQHGYSTSIGGGPYAPSGQMSISADHGGEIGNMAEVPLRCLSACAYAFLGGVTRSYGEDEKYGLHQFFDEKAVSAPTVKAFDATDLSLQQVISGLVVDYVVRMGVDARVVAEASQTLYDDVKLLSVKEATDLKVSSTLRASPLGRSKLEGSELLPDPVAKMGAWRLRSLASEGGTALNASSRSGSRVMR